VLGTESLSIKALAGISPVFYVETDRKTSRITILASCHFRQAPLFALIDDKNALKARSGW